MNRIYRYPIDVDDEVSISMPKGAQILSVSNARHQPECWALVDPDAPEELREFHIVDTGNPLPDDLGRFIGTIVEFGGALVWHLFEKEANP